MGRLRSLCLVSTGMSVFLAMTATAQTIQPFNSTMSGDSAFTLVTSMGDDMVPLAPVLPLTTAAQRNLPPMGLAGTIFLANATSALNIGSRDIAAINCDTVPGELQADYLFNQAVTANASAVLFYSPTNESCTLEEYDGTYGWVYSMRSADDTERLLDAVDQSFETEQDLWVQIALADTVQVSGDDDDDNANANDSSYGGRDLRGQPGTNRDDGNQSPLGPSPTTAVAMIILYSITGIITALFLAIIVTGALRAHRHPERYGPRNIIGRPRQSRAKGIARAMLETLPIVKFGKREEDPKPGDIEMADNGGSNRQGSADEQSAAREINAASPPQIDGSSRPTNGAAAGRQSTADDGIAAAVSGARRNSKTGDPDHLGCSICTEDFEEGQDQRVLPCDHRFHPDCVDPWLLNVSGTCPLCRIDLHPPAEEPELDEHGNPVQRETDENGNPLPLASEATADRQRMSVRRSLLIGLIGSRSVDRMSQEERLATLRQLRARRDRTREANANANATSTTASEGESQQAGQEDPRRVRDRLRRAFGVRTRRTEASSEDAARW